MPRTCRFAASISIATLLVLPLAGVALSAPVIAAPGPWRWPAGATAKPVVLRGFEAPAHRYGAGHRGVDIAAAVGAPIFAPADGVVAFVGIVALTPIVVLDHGGGVRTTYQPLVSELRAGQSVKAGQALGEIAKTTSHCLSVTGPPQSCLHWGVRNSTRYLDPLRFVHTQMPVLLPLFS